MSTPPSLDAHTNYAPYFPTKMAPPKFAGLTGRPLGLTVSTIATMGFLLFGYDRKFSLVCCVVYCLYTACVGGWYAPISAGLNSCV